MSTIIQEIKRIVCLQLGLHEIGDNDHFVEVLRAESVDIMNIVVAVEDKFNIEIKESEIPHHQTATALSKLVEERQ